MSDNSIFYSKAKGNSLSARTACFGILHIQEIDSQNNVADQKHFQIQFKILFYRYVDMHF